MYIHTYSYQKWDKHSLFNPQWEIGILWMMFKVMAITDLFEVIVKKKSITTKETKKDIIIYDLLFPILLLLIQIWIFKDVQISGYKHTFLLVKTILMIMNSVKIILIFHRGKFVADLVKLVDTVWIINLMLIMLTDPEVNTPDRKNLIIFYEVYFRYLEYHILMLVFPLIRNYSNIDTEISHKLYTTSTIIGKNDTYRICVILIFSHYYFPLVNGIAYSLKYWISFTSMIPAFFCINSFRQNKMKRVYSSFIIVIIWNITTYLGALYFSAPNVGDGRKE